MADNDPNNPGTLEGWIDQVVDPASLPADLPAMPRNVVMLFGYLSDAQRFAAPNEQGEIVVDKTTDREAYRLYRTPQLNDYLIIKVSDILFRGKVNATSNVYGGSIVWVKPEAQLQYVYTETLQAQASFLQGHFTNGGIGAGFSPGGGGNGGASFACGGASFACGGASFACGGASFACGGASFACGGASFACGGASFACGGASFACGGASFACGGASFACGGASFACGGASFACGGASFACGG